MDTNTNSRKRCRDSRTINEKYEIILTIGRKEYGMYFYLKKFYNRSKFKNFKTQLNNIRTKGKKRPRSNMFYNLF